MPKELTLKEQKFIDIWIKTGNGTLAIKEAGFEVANDNVASNKAWRLLRKAKILETIDDELAIVGITPEYRYQKLKEVLECNNPRFVLEALELIWKVTGKLDKKQSSFEDLLPIPIMGGLATNTVI